MATKSSAPAKDAVRDHSVSERRFHRALYVLRYLRAVALNISLALAAGTLYLVMGVSGLYPLTDFIVAALDAQLTDQQRTLLPPWFIAAVLGGMILLMIAFFSWTFFSIVRHRRWSLRIQAMAAVVIALAWSFNEDTQRYLAFAFESLDPVFAGLGVLSLVIVALVALDIAWALGAASLVREGASFRAAFEPRLNRSTWGALNRFLDFPRTPFVSWRQTLAWGLDVAAAVMLVAGVVYILSVGSVQNRIAAFEGTCSAAMLEECRNASLGEAWIILAGLVLSFVALKASGLLRTASRRLGALRLDQALGQGDSRFLLYLRPFDADDVILPKPRLPLLSAVFSFRPFPARIEEELFDVSDGFLPLVAVGKPGAVAEGRSAYRAFLADEEWQGFVRDKIRRAQATVIVLKDTEGVRWELETLTAEGAADRTLFLFDPSARNEAVWRRLADEARDTLSIGHAGEPVALAEGAIGFWKTPEGWVSVVNRNWSTTSYRTAFSEFLAERVAPAVI